ncbi:MAG: hypothetical protein MAG581_00826 [Deltaproteobacteria bacterium]|jgi:hypothetical protein|nr:hypothetical protein [Deltaproteobacteria bacterium]
MLSQTQIGTFWEQGFVLAENEATPEQLQANLELRPQYEEDLFFELQGQATAGKV